MPSLNSIVKVSITKTTITLQTRDFNRAVFVYEHTAFPENIKEYANIEAVLEDFAVNTPAYKFAAGAFAQDIQPSSILIGKKAAANSWTTTLQTLARDEKRWFYFIPGAAGATDGVTVSDIPTLAEAIGLLDKAMIVGHEGTTDIAIPQAIKAGLYPRVLAIAHGDNDPAKFLGAVWARCGLSAVGSSVWAYKQVKGILPTTYSASDEADLLGANSNIFTSIAGVNVTYGNFKSGIGEWFDVDVGIVWLKARIQESVFLVLLSNEKVAYRNDGVAAIETAVKVVLDEAVKNGLLTNDPAPKTKVPDVNELTAQQRDSRILPSVEFSAQLAGAIQYVDGIVGKISA